MTDAWQEMDDWCAKRYAKVVDLINSHILNGAPVVHFLPCVSHAASNASRRVSGSVQRTPRSAP